MRAADLMGLPVYDVDGELVGHVHDLRLQASGKPGCAGYVLSAFACSRKFAVGHRLGYGDDDMAGPWPLDRLFRRFAARGRVVEWADVTSLTPERIDIARLRGELRSAVEGEEAAR